ncbi:hypothetical protein F5878DRAFT_668094 [Lentinula raphanica]|uniref:Uncharacterized protein n=1 Tax=Lentinula raphanica TaxID=153919 RepID=A0AA38U3J5_9AGAR|nr:hypothetical protein F5878DRAFT_668094 [Lentinula raphanica]
MSQTCKQPDQALQCPRPAQMATTMSQTCSIGHDHTCSNGHDHVCSNGHNYVSDMLKQPRLCLRHAQTATTMSQTCKQPDQP